MSTLPAREAYRLWAPAYEPETAISALEVETVSALGVSVHGRALLDVGCGTARRLRNSGAAHAVGIDLSVDMLRQAPESCARIAGDVRALPVAAGSFDVVWCRLVLGHVQDLEPAYTELARVCRDGGAVVVTDLSPQAAAAGHRRTFRDESGASHDVEHFVHTVSAHARAAEHTGLSLIGHHDGVVGESIRQFYTDAGRLRAFDEQRGLPIILALAWRKVPR